MLEQCLIDGLIMPQMWLCSHTNSNAMGPCSLQLEREGVLQAFQRLPLLLLSASLWTVTDLLAVGGVECQSGQCIWACQLRRTARSAACVHRHSVWFVVVAACYNKVSCCCIQWSRPRGMHCSGRALNTVPVKHGFVSQLGACLRCSAFALHSHCGGCGQ